MVHGHSFLHGKTKRQQSARNNKKKRPRVKTSRLVRVTIRLMYLLLNSPSGQQTDAVVLLLVLLRSVTVPFSAGTRPVG